jgi:endonuclease YncB( thermonuclease family)
MRPAHNPPLSPWAQPTAPAEGRSKLRARTLGSQRKPRRLLRKQGVRVTVIKSRRPPRRPAPRRASRRRPSPPRGGVFRLGLTLGVLAGLVLTWAAADTGKIQRLPDAAISGRPTRIVDGDTFDIGGHRIRLNGSDAPEMSTPHGEPAKRHLATLLAAGPVACEDTGARTYNRVVARCFIADGRDLDAAMVEDGWAVAMTRFSGGRYVLRQLAAMISGRGMHGRHRLAKMLAQ